MSDVELKEKALQKWRNEFPPIPSRKERRKLWKLSRKYKSEHYRGNHIERTRLWRDSWATVTAQLRKQRGRSIRALFEAINRPSKYLGENKE